jgi:inorganic pyrophosphatase
MIKTMYLKKKLFFYYKMTLEINNIKTRLIDDKTFFFHNETIISPFHHIPIKQQYYNVVIEIPKMTKKKMEINMKDAFNPIIQDVENDKPREYDYGYMLFNYGMLPQTWENPDELDPISKLPGDGDPIDIIEIGYQQKKIGDIVQVKILGVLPLIDQNETDWKIICIDINDVFADKINDIDDIDKVLPGTCLAIKSWFQNYKFKSKGIINNFVFENFGNKELALEIIEHGHGQYKKKFLN